MNVRVRLFALAKQQAGAEFVDLELSDQATVGELRTALLAHLPELAAVIRLSMVAVDAQYASDTEKLSARSDVALIPPVSGG